MLLRQRVIVSLCGGMMSLTMSLLLIPGLTRYTPAVFFPQTNGSDKNKPFHFHIRLEQRPTADIGRNFLDNCLEAKGCEKKPGKVRSWTFRHRFAELIGIWSTAHYWLSKSVPYGSSPDFSRVFWKISLPGLCLENFCPCSTLSYPERTSSFFCRQSDSFDQLALISADSVAGRTEEFCLCMDAPRLYMWDKRESTILCQLALKSNH